MKSEGDKAGLTRDESRRSILGTGVRTIWNDVHLHHWHGQQTGAVVHQENYDIDGNRKCSRIILMTAVLKWRTVSPLEGIGKEGEQKTYKSYEEWQSELGLFSLENRRS